MAKHTITRDTHTWLLMLDALNDKADALWDAAMGEGADWEDGALADESRRFCLIADDLADELGAIEVLMEIEECACWCGCALGVEGPAGEICTRCSNGDHDHLDDDVTHE